MMTPRVKYAGPFPACFESQGQYDSWLEAARTATHGKPLMMGACADCTPEFKQRMESCGRCENQHVYFRVDKYGMLGGHARRQADEKAIYKEGWLR